MIADELRALAALARLNHKVDVDILLALADRVEAVERDAARYRARRDSAYNSHTFEQRAVMNAVNLRSEFNQSYDAQSDAAIKEQADAPGWFDPNSHGRGGI